MVQEWQVVKLESSKKSPFSLLKRTFFRTFNFDGLSFLNHWEFRHVMYLILKVWSVVKWSQQLKGVAGLLPCVTPSWKKPFYTIKGPVYGFPCPSVYYANYLFISNLPCSHLTYHTNYSFISNLPCSYLTYHANHPFICNLPCSYFTYHVHMQLTMIHI